ncbi:FAD-dependent oxidoreductase [Halopseudomonas maritima]|uniref:FAD-dependent oxidoreductase n=1 Tax=Halopseudomonas maritima TaxID=2918528 RepID=UPI001EE9EB24|nr:FAD-dependent oxidoreductase [Halopseudomonas maritima]UJJ31134.1 FAD-dependent oxidoreductase [Halopseudomonas maritima]
MPPVPLLLAGAGHAHLVTLQRWRAEGYHAPVGSCLINPTAQAWYSGMLPGLLAGRWQAEQCCIELAPLCAAVGVSLRLGEITQLDANSQQAQLADQSRIRWQWLSLGVGGAPQAPAHNDHSITLLPAKPFAGLYQQCRTWQQQNAPQRLAIIGGGAAAVELALALARLLPATQLNLFSAGPLLAALPARAGNLVRPLLRQRGISYHEGVTVTGIQNGQLWQDTQVIGAADAALLASGNMAPHWLADSAMTCDATGAVRIQPNLQSSSHPTVFATGDCASLSACPHNGVQAVRQGAVLAENLSQVLCGDQATRQFKPPRHSLALLATADEQAIATRNGIALRSRLALRLKDRLDNGFIRAIRGD